MNLRFVLFVLLVRKIKLMLFRLLLICLRDKLIRKSMIDVGIGVEHQIGVTKTRLDTAVAVLKEQGYAVHNVNDSAAWYW